MRAAGHTFAFVKATEGPSVPGGTFYTNPWYGADSQDAMAAGLYVGSYDFAEPALPLSTAALQARAFVSVVGSQHGRQQLPPVLDLEQTGGLSATNLRSWVQSWLTETQHLTGRTPMIYTGPNFWKTAMGNTSAMSGYHLWLASWTSAKTPGVLPGGWSTWTMWQYTDAAKVAGITGSVDLSRYCCTMSNLAGLADGSNDRGASNPFGNLDGTARAPGTLTVSGWAIDPDTNAPLTVHVYVDGKYATKGVTGVSRPDVAASYPGWGSDRGYSITVPVTAGTHTVCAYGINQLIGTSNSKLGCRTVSGDPVGALQSLTQVPGGVRVQGWVADPDSPDPTTAHIYVDGKMRASVTGGPRSFSVAIGAMADGPHTFCEYGVDSQHLVPNPKLGCLTFTVAGAPFGHLESVTAVDGGIEVSGWAIDPDTSAPDRRAPLRRRRVEQLAHRRGGPPRRRGRLLAVGPAPRLRRDAVVAARPPRGVRLRDQHRPGGGQQEPGLQDRRLSLGNVSGSAPSRRNPPPCPPSQRPTSSEASTSSNRTSTATSAATSSRRTAGSGSPRAAR